MSNERYTPTTGEVRAGYVDYRDQTSWTLPSDANAEFSRWLNEHDRDVKAQALRGAAELARYYWTGYTNLPHPDDPTEAACSFDVWLEVLADRQVAGK